MMNTEEILKKSERLREGTLDLAEKIREQGSENQLPPVEGMGEAVTALRENTYNVVVCGEIKAGKTTFINCLLGEEVLPAATKVATAQAFRIANKPVEAYRLRLSDGSAREIKRAELATYGSQVELDKNAGAGDLKGLTIDCIEIDYPARFLPENLVLIDTPGLGALYSQHALVTNHFAREADAVIFVLDSRAPVKESECEALAKLTKATPNIFFIQTRIDEKAQEVSVKGTFMPQWQEVQQRTEAILQDKFASSLARPVRVWPISSRLMLTAATEKDEVRAERQIKSSRFRELLVELQKYLFFVAGWSRAGAFAYDLAAYGASQLPTLQGRLDSLRTDDTEVLQARKNDFDAKRLRLRKEWAETGQKYCASTAEIDKAAKACGKEFDQLFTSAGTIYGTLITELNQLNSMSASKAFLEKLEQRIPELFFSEYESILNCFQNTIEKHQVLLKEDMAIAVPYQDTGKSAEGLLETFGKMTSDRPQLRPRPRGYVHLVRRAASGLVRGALMVLLPWRAVAFVGDLFANALAPETERVEEMHRGIRNRVISVLQDLRATLTRIDIQASQYEPENDRFIKEEVTRWKKHVKDALTNNDVFYEQEVKLVNDVIKKQVDTVKAAAFAEEKLATWKGLQQETEGLLQLVTELNKAAE